MTVVCLAVGAVLVFSGSIPFSGVAPFAGEPIDASAGQRVIGALLIVAGLVVGLALPLGIGLWTLRGGRR